MFAAALVLGFYWATGQEPADPPAARACGTAGPFDFDTFEIEGFVEGYATAIGLAVEGKLFPSTFMVAGEPVDVRYQGLKSGPRTARLNESTARRIPPSIYKSIAWVESSWANASSSVPYGGVGPVLRSFDCGYGLGQITSGMTNNTGATTPRQAAIGTHYLANLAEGVRILADKWNQAPRFRPIAGNGDPAVIEDWYYAIWSYNGFAFSNHPLNPLRDPLRGGTATSPIYHCQDTSAPSYQAVGNSPKFGYGDYTYPERVYGCMQYPPQVTVPGASSPSRLYAKQDVTMPDFRISKVAQAFNPVNFTTCESGGFNSGCPSMDFPTAIEEIYMPPTPTPGPGGGGQTYTVVDGDSCISIAEEHGITLQRFFQLNPSIQEDCSNLQAGQVVTIRPAPTPTPSASPTPGPLLRMVPHVDATPPADASVTALLLGQPLLVYSGAANASIVIDPAGTSGSTTLSISNVGTGIGAFRIRTSVPWLVARHAGDSSGRTLDGGVAIGQETEVVTQAPRANPPRERVAQKGYTSVLSISAIGSAAPPGVQTAKLWIEPILSSGAPFELTVTVDNRYTGAPPTPTPTVDPSPGPKPFRAIAPQIGKDSN